MKSLSQMAANVSKPGSDSVAGILWYRIRKYFYATLVSVFFAFMLVGLLCFLIGIIYPDFKSYYKKLPFHSGNSNAAKYNFYSGENGGVYSAIGKAVTNDMSIIYKDASVPEKIGVFRNHDILRNYATGGGFDNFMKVSTQKNSFGIVQEAVINLQDEQLRKGILMETPLFMERLHIFYRKSLFPNIAAEEIQLSANTDSCILKRLRDSVKNIQVGIVGSCTRIIASDVIDLLERQMTTTLGKKKIIGHHYKLNDYPLATALRWMHQYRAGSTVKPRPDSLIDMMFLVAADPTNDITRILDSGNYQLMSVTPSFMGLLNKEFNLNLHVADFYKKYNGEKGINTVGTLSFLIASADMQNNDVKRMVRRIHKSSQVIHKTLITLPAGCTNECYSGNNDKCKFILPLSEFGFFKRIEDEDNASDKEATKAMIPFLIAMISFFFPVLKSISWLKSVWMSWRFNKVIDELLHTHGETFEQDMQTVLINITDLSGEGVLSEAHYNAMAKRIAIHLPEKRYPVLKEVAKKKRFAEGRYKQIS